MTRLAARPPLDLYVLLDAAATGGRELVAVVDQVLAGGARWVQLRAKALGTRDLTALAERVGARVRAAGGMFIVNDRLDVALAAGADGVHLGQEDLPAGAARRLAPGLVLGVSTHGVEQARHAVAAGADYVAIGAVFPTGSKPGFELVGLEMVRRVRPHVPVPLVAIGGITAERVRAVLAAGADGVAVASAVVGAADPAAAAAELLGALRAGPRLDTARDPRP